MQCSNTFWSVLGALTMLSLATGCATLGGPPRRRRALAWPGNTRRPIDKVWGAIPVVLSELQLPLVSQNRADGTVLAQRGITPLSYGENVAIFVESVNQAKTRVEVTSKKAMARTYSRRTGARIFWTSWARSFGSTSNRKRGLPVSAEENNSPFGTDVPDKSSIKKKRPPLGGRRSC